jgi:hypothetical protein
MTIPDGGQSATRITLRDDAVFKTLMTCEMALKSRQMRNAAEQECKNSFRTKEGYHLECTLNSCSRFRECAELPLARGG